MKVTCALTTEQVTNLYKHAYKSMLISLNEGKSFDADMYLKEKN